MEKTLINIIYLSLLYTGVFFVPRRTYFKAKFSNFSWTNLTIKFLMALLISCILSYYILFTLNYSELTLTNYFNLIGFVIPTFLLEVFIIFNMLINFKDILLGVLYDMKIVVFRLILIKLSLFLGIWLSYYLFQDNYLVVKIIAISLPVVLMIWKVQSLIPLIIKWWVKVKTNFSNKSYSLVLRSFSDKTPLEAPGSFSINSGNEYSSITWVEGSSILTNLTKALSKIGPVAVLGEMKFSNKGDIARASEISSTDKDWKCKIDKLAKGANLIILVPSSSKGVVWEIKYLLENNMLEKTLVFMPNPLVNNFESNEMALLEYWGNLAKELKQHGLYLPDYEGAGCFYRPKKDLSMGDRVYLNDVAQYQTINELKKAILKLQSNTHESEAILKDVFANLKEC